MKKKKIESQGRKNNFGC